MCPAVVNQLHNFILSYKTDEVNMSQWGQL